MGNSDSGGNEIVKGSMSVFLGLVLFVMFVAMLPFVGCAGCVGCTAGLAAIGAAQDSTRR